MQQETPQKPLDAYVQKGKDLSLNNSILGYCSLFVNEHSFLQACLVINPFGFTEIRNDFDPEIVRILQLLNSMHLLDKSFLKRDESDFVKKVKILFLSIQKCIFDKNSNKEDKNLMLHWKKIRYALDILETLPISALRDSLEDQCFEYLDPKVFNQYVALRKDASECFQDEEQSYKYDLENRLRKNGIDAFVRSRIKTIYSIHKKIIKKNILYSQVLDTIGFRIVTQDPDDCYKVMAIILKNWPIMNSKIKDYIALPKANGYESIHITIVYNKIPVEIQIRSAEMDRFAEYGAAKHELYKQGMEDD